MVIDILRGSFQFREVISKAYFKVLDKDTSHTLLPVDYWILFSLFDLVKFRTKVLTIFNKRSTNRRQTKRSEEQTSELQSLMRISYAVFCLNKKKKNKPYTQQ